jgi:hypothetical protein
MGFSKQLCGAQGKDKKSGECVLQAALYRRKFRLANAIFTSLGREFTTTLLCPSNGLTVLRQESLLASWYGSPAGELVW